jgi:hypothetical protein
MDGEYNFSSMSLTSKPSMEKLMSPKSPLPGFVDFHGKRKQMVKIQVLEREIGLLQVCMSKINLFHLLYKVLIFCANLRKSSSIMKAFLLPK